MNNIHNFFIYDNISSKLFPSYNNYLYHQNCLNVKRNNINFFRNKDDNLLKKKRNENINGQNRNSCIPIIGSVTRKNNYFPKYNEYRKTFDKFSAEIHNLHLAVKNIEFSDKNLLFQIQKIWTFYQKTKIDCLTQKVLSGVYNNNQVNQIVENFYKKILIVLVLIYTYIIWHDEKAPNQSLSKLFAKILYHLFQMTK